MTSFVSIVSKPGKAAVIIATIACAVYANTLFNGFVYDDIAQVVENPWIRDIRHLPEIFSTDVAGFKQGEASNYYRPLMHVFYLLTCSLFGPAPWGFHLVNVLFHAAVSVLVLFIMFVLNSRSSSVPHSSLPFFGALLFAVHPVHTEAVAWIAAIPDLSATFFSLLAIFLYVRALPQAGAPYVLSAGAFFLASLCKETALITPFILVAYDSLYRNGVFLIRHYAVRYSPFFVAAGVYLVLRFQALGAFKPLQNTVNPDLAQFIVNSFPVLVKYLGKLLFPVNLNGYYVLHSAGSFADPRVIASIIATVIFFAAALLAFRKSREVFFVFVLMAVPLLPGIYAAVADGNFAERNLYFPSAGFVMLVSITVAAAFVRRFHLNTVPAGLFIVVIVVMLSAATFHRNTVWKDNVTFWSDTVAKSPDGAIPHAHLADALFTEKRRVDKAIEHYHAALRLQPGMITARNNLGLAYMTAGQPHLAVEQYQIVLRLRPDSVQTMNNLGLVYKNLGLIDQAIAQYQAALKLMPDHPGLHYNIATCYAMKGEKNKSAEHFSRAKFSGK